MQGFIHILCILDFLNDDVYTGTYSPIRIETYLTLKRILSKENSLVVLIKTIQCDDFLS